MKSQEEHTVRAQAEQVRGRLQELNADLRAVEDEFDGLAPQRNQHELLAQACSSLEKLGDLGAASLFWGEQIAPARVDERLREVRGIVDSFQTQLGELDGRRQAILDKIAREEENLEILGADLDEILEEQERKKLEWIVEREISPVRPRAQLMAWARGGEDDRRFRKSLGGSLLASLLLGALLPMIDLPLPERFLPEDMPKRLAQLVREEQARLLQPKPVVPQPEPEQPEPEVPDPAEQPEPADTPTEAPVTAEEPDPGAEPSIATDPDAPPVPSMAQADAPGPQKVQKAGILAFRDEFAGLAKDKVAPRLGADARFTNADEASKGSTTRSMLTTNAPGSSGGINVGALSRNVGGGGGRGGGGGGGIHGVQVGRASSSISSIGGGERPLASGGGPGPSRTDEEIQIVFDRYKASFYRLYNRQLRNDPTLQGQMVLRLTIEPDGSVSMCKLESTDMDAPDLAAQVVDRVLTINFGAKEGVKTLTIVYPIDFLPAA